MTTDLETIKNRIAKMLATASNDGATPGEKATAMQMASALMRRYNLERDDIEDINKKENYNSSEVNALWARLTPWESSLAAFVSAYIVKGSWVVASKEGSTHRQFGTVGQAKMTFVGLGQDAAIAVATFNQLRDSLLRQCNVKFGSPVRGSGRSYAVGFVDGLYNTARAAEKAEQLNVETKAEVTRALIRTDMLKAQAKNWYLKETDSTVKSSARRLSGIESGAYSTGVRDGQRVNAQKGSVVSGHIN